jgi:hypothetical protein
VIDGSVYEVHQNVFTFILLAVSSEVDSKQQSLLNPFLDAIFESDVAIPLSNVSFNTPDNPHGPPNCFQLMNSFLLSSDEIPVSSPRARMHNNEYDNLTTTLHCFS